jgi:hypothetical protein
MGDDPLGDAVRAGDYEVEFSEVKKLRREREERKI